MRKHDYFIPALVCLFHSRGGHYQTSAAWGDKIGTFFNRHPNGDVDRRTDVYAGRGR